MLCCHSTNCFLVTQLVAALKTLSNEIYHEWYQGLGGPLRVEEVSILSRSICAICLTSIYDNSHTNSMQLACVFLDLLMEYWDSNMHLVHTEEMVCVLNTYTAFSKDHIEKYKTASLKQYVHYKKLKEEELYKKHKLKIDACDTFI